MQKNNYVNKTHKTGIVLDEDNKLLLSYDLLSNGEIDTHTEGILKELNKDIADETSKHFDISLADYGVDVCSESIDFEG